MTERRGMTGQPVPRGMASWSWVPPAVTGRQVEGTGLLPFGRYEMPDGSQQVSFGLPQGLLDAYRSVRYGLGYEQDPNAPKGYTSFDAMNKGAFGAAGGAITGALGAGAARAIRSGMPRNVVSSGGAPEPPMKPITAYHGSPHDFDKFSVRRVGDGENEIEFGHGLYFAESPKVAEHYRDTLSGFRVAGGGDYNPADPAHAAASLVRQHGGDVAKARAEIRQAISRQTGQEWAKRILPKNQEILRALDAPDRMPKFESTGKIYRVDINARPEQFLDFYKPISQQPPAVQRAIQSRFGQQAGTQSASRFAPETYDDMVALRDAGIPGIRYLDQGSRTDGKGTYNYVIFDDGLVKIAEKYGFVIPGPNGMPAVSEENYQKLQAMQQ